MPSSYSALLLSLAVVVAAVIGPLTSVSLTLTGAGYHDDQRVLGLLCLLLGAAGAAVGLIKGGPISARLGWLTLRMLIVFFVLGLFSSMLAYSPRHALYEWSSFSLLLLLAGRIANEVARQPDAVLDSVLRLCGLGCALYVFKSVLIYAWLLEEGGQPDPGEFITGFNNYRFFNHIQTITLPLLSLLVLRTSQKSTIPARPAIGWSMLLSFWWMLLFVSAGRGTFVGVLAGIMMVLFWRGRHALPWCRVMLCSSLMGLAAYVAFYVAVPLLVGLQPFGFLSGVAERSLTNPSSSRWALWQRAGEMVAAHPLLGAGPLHFAHEGQSIGNGAHPHNWTLQIASEWGLPALLCFGAVIVQGFRKLLHAGHAMGSGDQQNQAILTVWLGTGVAIVVDGLVSGLLVMPSSQLWIVLYLGCAWGWTSAFSRPEKFREFHYPRSAKIGLVLTILTMLVFLAWGVWPEIFDLAGYENLQSENHPGLSAAPRLWGFGYF